ncbi:MAG: LuxR C-terminal-related transcriptional regulator [Bacteroidetes bacterium]|nr:LuxR C-terminal-related transcriptional regulator [Bacteroidota bacterium]
MINILLLIFGASGIVISALLYFRNKNKVIKIYFQALIYWTLAQFVTHSFYYFNEIIFLHKENLNLILNDLSFIFLAPFIYLLLILVHEIFNIKLGEYVPLGIKIAALFIMIPCSNIMYYFPEVKVIFSVIEIIKGALLYGLLYYIAFDINKHLASILNDDIRTIFRFVFYLQMIFYPMMIIESVFFFDRIYPFGISAVTLFYATVNVLWLYFVSRYLHLPEIKLISEDDEFDNYFAIYKITKREMEVVRLLLRGMSYEQIAGQLFITLETVKTHVNNIYKKSDVNSKIDLSNLVQKCKNS